MLNSYEQELPSYNIEEVYRSEYQPVRFGSATKTSNLLRIAAGMALVYLLYKKMQ